jgi:hypothetical protein
MTNDERLELNDADLRAVMGTAHGRRLVWRLLVQAGLYSSSYAADALATAFNEGRRSVGLALMAEAQRVTTDLYVAMVREQLNVDLQQAHAPKPPRNEE